MENQRGLLCSEKETFAEVPALLKRFLGAGEESDISTVSGIGENHEEY